MTKLSIITVNLNNASGLQKTLESVASQTFSDLEHIIIDGGSTDGSIDVIKQYVSANAESGLKIVYWVSEKDSGIYNAMNKGIKQAKGEYCLFLNSGDWIVSSAAILDVISHSNGFDLVINNLVYSLDGEIIEQKFPESISMKFLAYSNIPHCSTLIKRGLFDKYGYYSESYKIVSDHLFFLTLFLIHKVNFTITQLPLTYFDTNGISSSEEFKRLGYDERLCAQNEVLPSYVWQFVDESMFLEEKYNGLIASRTVKTALLVSRMLRVIK